MVVHCDVAYIVSFFVPIIVKIISHCPWMRLAHWGLSRRHNAKVPVVSMVPAFTWRNIICMTTYLFTFLTFSSTQVSWVSFPLGEHWPTSCHMLTLLNPRLFLGVQHSSAWATTCFCKLLVVEKIFCIDLDGLFGLAIAGAYLVHDFAEYNAERAVVAHIYEFPLTHE